MQPNIIEGTVIGFRGNMGGVSADHKVASIKGDVVKFESGMIQPLGILIDLIKRGHAWLVVA